VHALRDLADAAPVVEPAVEGVEGRMLRCRAQGDEAEDRAEEPTSFVEHALRYDACGALQQKARVADPLWGGLLRPKREWLLDHVAQRGFLGVESEGVDRSPADADFAVVQPDKEMGDAICGDLAVLPHDFHSRVVVRNRLIQQFA
jgi:hypothetical protein